MKYITANFCVHCRSQVRLNEDKQYIGYSPDCKCFEGLEKKDVRFFSLVARNLKSVFGFVLENNNSIVTHAQATDREGRFAR